AERGLIFHVVREVRERIALRLATFIGYGLIASCKRNRLEGEESDLLGIIQRELDDAADLLIINTVHNRHDRNDFHAGPMQVINSLQLHIKQVADFAMRIGSVADSIKLQV